MSLLLCGAAVASLQMLINEGGEEENSRESSFLVKFRGGPCELTVCT